MLTQNQFSQGSKMPEGKKKLRWFVALSALPLLGVVTAFGLVPQSDFDLTSNTVDIQEIALPKDNTNETPVASYWRDERVLTVSRANKCDLCQLSRLLFSVLICE